MSDPHILVTLCTYNERDNIPLLVPQIRQVLPEADVLVIDDNSPDGTGRVADELAAADGRIRVLHRRQRGKPRCRDARRFSDATRAATISCSISIPTASHDPGASALRELRAREPQTWPLARGCVPGGDIGTMGLRPALHEPRNRLVRAIPFGALHPRQ